MKLSGFLLTAIIFGTLAFATTPVAAEENIYRFSGVVHSFPHHPGVVSYDVYANVGATLSITLNVTGNCGFCGRAGFTVQINETPLMAVMLVLTPPPPPSTFPATFFGTEESTSYSIPINGYYAIEIRLDAGTVDPHGSWWMTMSYDVVISGVSLPTATIIEREQAAGLQRVGNDQSLPIIIYTPTPAAAANGDFFIDIWRLDENNIGQLALHISDDDLSALPEFPTSNTLIASTPDGFISVYKLTTGEYQVNVGPLADGKIHVLIFDAIPPTHTYGYTWDIAQ